MMLQRSLFFQFWSQCSTNIGEGRGDRKTTNNNEERLKTLKETGLQIFHSPLLVMAELRLAALLETFSFAAN